MGLKGINRYTRYICCILIILFIGNIISPSLFSTLTQARQIRRDQIVGSSEIQQGDPHYFFSYAFASGTFEVLDYKNIYGLMVHNISPNNLTMNVHAYYAEEHRWIFKQASYFYSYHYIGLVGRHFLFVFGFGGVTVAP